MSRQRKPDIEKWRESVLPETTPTPTPTPPSSDLSKEANGKYLLTPCRPILPLSSAAEIMTETLLPAHAPTRHAPRRRRVFFSHPRVYPILLKIRTVCWVNAVLQIVGLLFVMPTTSLEKHMSMLEDTNLVIRNMWWMYACSGAIQTEYHRRATRRELDGWIEVEKGVAWDRLLRNIGPVVGAEEGVVVASPSDGGVPTEPDYYYTWTRDAALIMSTIITESIPEEVNTTWPAHYDKSMFYLDHPIADKPVYEPLIREYVAIQSKIQQAVNPSGALWTGGLNEPKFQIDASRFDGDWGRPQRDGPALRALALIPYAHYLLDRGWPADLHVVVAHLYDPASIRAVGSVIKNDLEEVGGGWWLSSFDLWEEVDGHHLFTLLASRRALKLGAKLAMRLGDPKAAEYYNAQSKRIDDILPAFWNEQGYWQSTTHIEGQSDHQATEVDREWLDCALPLSIAHFGEDDLFAPTRSETLASLRAYITSFRDLYPINAPPKSPRRSRLNRFFDWLGNRDPTHGEADWAKGWAVGRYAEDVYNGIGMGQGNPWYICTFSVAQVFYLAKEGFQQQGYIPLNNLTRPFWSDLLGTEYDEEADGLWSAEKDEKRKPLETKLFRAAITKLGQVGDRYMSVGRKYAPGGRMSEQMNRHDGSSVGARDLTWSYASFIEAARARDRAGS